MKVDIFDLEASHAKNGILSILVLNPENSNDEVVLSELKRRKLCSNNEKLFEIIGQPPIPVKTVTIPLDERY